MESTELSNGMRNARRMGNRAANNNNNVKSVSEFYKVVSSQLCFRSSRRWIKENKTQRTLWQGAGKMPWWTESQNQLGFFFLLILHLCANQPQQPPLTDGNHRLLFDDHNQASISKTCAKLTFGSSPTSANYWPRLENGDCLSPLFEHQH